MDGRNSIGVGVLGTSLAQRAAVVRLEFAVDTGGARAPIATGLPRVARAGGDKCLGQFRM